MKLEERDVRAMVRLVGEVAALPGGPATRKRYLMEGLCKLIGADFWVWGLACRREPAMPEIYVSIMRGGFTDESFAKLLLALEHPEMVSLAAPFFTELAEKNIHLTRRREQITEEAVYQSSQARLLWEAAGISTLILSHRPLDARSCSALGFYRAQGRPKFSARDARIAHIVLTEVAWLHELGWPEDRGVQVPALSRRERLTLNLLTSGASHRTIATQMGITPGTLQGYIKTVYRHFGVHSQTELLNRLFRGDGMDGGE